MTGGDGPRDESRQGGGWKNEDEMGGKEEANRSGRGMTVHLRDLSIKDMRQNGGRRRSTVGERVIGNGPNTPGGGVQELSDLVWYWLSFLNLPRGSLYYLTDIGRFFLLV